MELGNPVWKTLEGGYRTIYDASVPLQLLEMTLNPQEVTKLLDELWENLHHQGDVGTASYLSVPQLARIARKKHLVDYSLLGLCSVIIQQSHSENNPGLPTIFIDYYQQGIDDLKKFVMENINNITDDTTYTIALSTLATCSGKIELGKAIMELCDNDVLNEFLEQF